MWYQRQGNKDVIKCKKKENKSTWFISIDHNTTHHLKIPSHGYFMLKPTPVIYCPFFIFFIGELRFPGKTCPTEGARRAQPGHVHSHAHRMTS